MRQQINALTSTRAIAAIMVVIHHFGYGVFPFTLSNNLFQSGNIPVSYFFVLSGFVLCISYSGVHVSYADYFQRRIGRIVPVYWLALLFMVPVAVFFLNYPLNGTALKEVLLSASFLQSWVPSYPLVLNSPAWSISVEMLFYAVFPFFLLLLNKNTKLFIGITVVLFLLSQYFHLKYYTSRWSLPDSIVDTVFFNPVMHISQFLIGMIGGYLYTNNRSSMPKSNWIAAGLLLLIIALIIYRPDNVSYHVGLIAPVFMIFVLSVAVNNASILNLQWFVFLGEISYGIYILQFPVFKFLEAVNKQYMHIPKQYFFFLGLLALLLVSALSYMFIEKPLRKKINSLKFG
ncbi:MAG: hypothetical protein K0Q79_844 [Flavipsychrobacter sp.]|jgi:peptidoglycan/LPS O-acetylase OafA/YrhL|nr:hypothetical protein [Flavipsychrobacter sp.]